MRGTGRVMYGQRVREGVHVGPGHSQGAGRGVMCDKGWALQWDEACHKDGIHATTRHTV